MGSAGVCSPSGKVLIARVMVQWMEDSSSKALPGCCGRGRWSKL